MQRSRTRWPIRPGRRTRVCARSVETVQRLLIGIIHRNHDIATTLHVSHHRLLTSAAFPRAALAGGRVAYSGADQDISHHGAPTRERAACSPGAREGAVGACWLSEVDEREAAPYRQHAATPALLRVGAAVAFAHPPTSSLRTPECHYSE